jgi:hypothetical protein
MKNNFIELRVRVNSRNGQPNINLPKKMLKSVPRTIKVFRDKSWRKMK